MDFVIAALEAGAFVLFCWIRYPISFSPIKGSCILQISVQCFLDCTTIFSLYVRYAYASNDTQFMPSHILSVCLVRSDSPRYVSWNPGCYLLDSIYDDVVIQLKDFHILKNP